MTKYKEIVINTEVKPEIFLTDLLRRAINASLNNQVQAKPETKTE